MYSEDWWSLDDMNVQGGGYNEHRVFFSRKAALNYLKILVAMGHSIG